VGGTRSGVTRWQYPQLRPILGVCEPRSLAVGLPRTVSRLTSHGITAANCRATVPSFLPASTTGRRGGRQHDARPAQQCSDFQSVALPGSAWQLVEVAQRTEQQTDEAREAADHAYDDGRGRTQCGAE
jgi:hypothetical protein